MAHDYLKIGCISDTHDIYYPQIPADVDAVIHAGDITLSGSPDETYRFLNWFDSLKIKHKIFIGGNHDKFLEQYGGAFMDDFRTIHMLWDSSYDLEGYKVWGSPTSPAYGHIRAFAKEREVLAEHWERVPMDAEILVTHGPARYMGDQSRPPYTEHLGDSDLEMLIHTVKPMLHVYGHIHGGRGVRDLGWQDGTFTQGKSVNAAVLNEAYQPYPDVEPIYIELRRKQTEITECKLSAIHQDVQAAL